jgi:hypothetical protein
MAIESRERIEKASLRTAKRKWFSWRNHSKCILRDAAYLKYDFQTEIMEAVKRSPVIKREKIPEFYDCNTMSDALAADIRWNCIGAPFGTVTFSFAQDGKWQVHVMCVFYDTEHGCFRYIESKDGSVKGWRKGWKLSEIRF